MQASPHDIHYDVTISEDLRAMMRARRSSARSQAGSRSGPCPSELGPRSNVFSRRRLRVDGRRPIDLMACEILTLRVGDDEDGRSQGPGPNEGCQRVTIFATDDGRCLAYVAAVPPSGLPARPVHRLRSMRTSGDVRAMVRECQADLVLCPAVQANGGNELKGPSSDLLKRQSTQMAEVLAPFVTTSST